MSKPKHEAFTPWISERNSVAVVAKANPTKERKPSHREFSGGVQASKSPTDLRKTEGIATGSGQLSLESRSSVCDEFSGVGACGANNEARSPVPMRIEGNSISARPRILPLIASFLSRYWF